MVKFIKGLSNKPSTPHVIVTGVSVVLGLVAVVFGVGLASVYASVYGEAKDLPMQAAAMQLNGMHLMTVPNHGKTTTFKVEIVRDGEVLCEAPEVKITDTMATSNLATGKTLDCPPLKDGDTVKANWASQSEVNISYSK